MLGMGEEMQSPKKTKYRKQQKQSRRVHLKANRGTKLTFGTYGLKAVEGMWLDARQLEAGRVTLSRTVKRGGGVFIRVFPDKPITKKPAETRMGSGKGAPEKWVAEVQAGRIIYELVGVEGALAKGALIKAAAKLPIRCKVVELKETLL
jgi:large subunit ribosomal protein L16